LCVRKPCSSEEQSKNMTDFPTPTNQITPIFGFGYMRSGTTLIFNILKLHPEIYTGAQEPKIIDSLHSIKNEYPDLSIENILLKYIAYLANVARFGSPIKHLGEPLIENELFTESDLTLLHPLAINLEYIQVMNLVYNLLASKSQKKYWYIKSQVAFFADIHQWMPNALFIEIIRDPRDVIASKKKDKESVWHSTKYSVDKRKVKYLEKTYDPIWDSLSWKAECSAGTEIIKIIPDHIFIIKYEDLVRDPETYTKDLCGFLNTKFYKRQLDVPKRNSSLWENRPAGIGPESINKWKKILTSEEIVLCQSISKHEMQLYFYEIKNIKPNLFKLISILLGSIAEFFARLVKRLRMNGLKFVMNIIRLYWRKFIQLIRA